MGGTLSLALLLCVMMPGASPLQPNENVDTSVQQQPLKSLYIAAVFPMKGHGGWLGGQGCLPAALMALEDVNKRSDLLIGYQLEIDWRDSQVRRPWHTSRASEHAGRPLTFARPSASA